jgi:paraquat-inducible protein A
MRQDRKKSLQALHPKRIDIPLLVVVSTVLFIVGLKLPVLTVQKLWEKNTFSIASGITNLWQEKHYTLAVIIIFFSVIFPIFKLIMLLMVWFVRLSDPQRKSILYYLAVLGKWSMLDVFITAIIMVSVQLGALASAKAENGIYFFGASILVAMIAATLENHLAKNLKHPL